MLNLLPKDQKSKFVREYRIRFLVIVCALAFAGEIISLVLLIPPFLTARTRLNILNSASASLTAQNLTTESSNLSSIVQQTNNYLNIFTPSSTPVGVVAALQNIVGVRDGSVRIRSFVYKISNEEQQVVISGNADSRESLLAFVKKLKSQPGVVSADLPISDFAQSQNIDFSLSVLMNSQHI